MHFELGGAHVPFVPPASMANKTAVSAPPLPPWGSALAGATGAVLANAVVYPLDMYPLPTRPSLHVAA